MLGVIVALTKSTVYPQHPVFPGNGPQSTSYNRNQLAITAGIAAALYGKYWTNKVVEFIINNQAVVDIIRSGYSRESHLMHLTQP